MNDLEEALRELGRRLDGDDPPHVTMDPRIRRRIRRRQAWAVMGTMVLAAIVGSGVWAGVRLAGPSGGTTKRSVSNPKTVTPSPSRLATIQVDTLEFYWDLVRVNGVDRLRVSSKSGDGGVFDFPPDESLVATSFSAGAETETGVGGIVTNEAADVFVEMSDGRSIKAQLITLPPTVSDSYVLFVAQVKGPLTDYDVVGTDADGREVARHHYEAP